MPISTGYSDDTLRFSLHLKIEFPAETLAAILFQTNVKFHT